MHFFIRIHPMFRQRLRYGLVGVAIMKMHSDGSDDKTILGIPQSSVIIEKAGFIAQVDYFRKVPIWVLEHYTNKTLGKAQGVSRKDVPFVKDEALPAIFQSTNRDYHKSGYSRGHMAAAAAHKQTQQHMNDTFYLSNMVPQDFENNKQYWAQFESWTRELIKNGFEEVWVLSGPCYMPYSFDQTHLKAITDGKSVNVANFDIQGPEKDVVTYQTIGKQRVAVPSHLYKVIVGKLPEDKQTASSAFPDYMVAAFLIPNKPIPEHVPLTQFEVPLVFLEKFTGIHVFPKLDRNNLGLLCTTQILINQKYQSLCSLKPSKYRNK